MSRKFITSILIAAVTVTGLSLSAAPAKAGNDDLAKLLFGATALVIIGKAVSDRNRHSTAPAETTRYDDYRWEEERRKRREARRNFRQLPASCLRQHYTRDGRVRMMSAHCLERKYNHVSRLPQACKARVRTENGPRRGYKMRCLRDRGFRLASN